MASFQDRFLTAPTLRLFLAVGILGGFTTFSSFSYETVALLHDGEWFRGGANVIASVLGCLTATYLGGALGKLL